MHILTFLAACAALGCASPVPAPVLGEAAGTDVSVALVLDGGGSIEASVPRAPTPDVAVPKPSRGRRSRQP